MKSCCLRSLPPPPPHDVHLSSNRRMNVQVKNLERKSEAERTATANRAQYIRRKLRKGEA